MKRNQDGDLFRVGLYMDPKRDDAIFTGHRSLFKARNRAFAMSAHNGVSAVWNDRDEVVVLFLPFWLFFWLSCRLTAKRCPECGSKWRTELQNEWVYESWKCHSCGHCWEARCGW